MIHASQVRQGDGGRVDMPMCGAGLMIQRSLAGCVRKGFSRLS